MTPTFEDLVSRWKAYRRHDAIERYRIVSDMAGYLDYNTGDTQRLSDAAGIEYRTLLKYLRVVRKFSEDDATRMAAQGYGWSHLVLMAARTDSGDMKDRALGGGAAPRVMKAELNARPVAAKSAWGCARDRFLTALSDASPAQICNWLETYIRDSCAPGRADAIRSGLRRVVNEKPKRREAA